MTHSIDHLDEQYRAAIALRELADFLLSTDAAQFIHKYVRVPDTQYTVRHQREGCGLCDLLEVVANGLEYYRHLAKDVNRRGDQPTSEWVCDHQVTYTGTDDFISGARNAHLELESRDAALKRIEGLHFIDGKVVGVDVPDQGEHAPECPGCIARAGLEGRVHGS